MFCGLHGNGGTCLSKKRTVLFSSFSNLFGLFQLPVDCLPFQQSNFELSQQGMKDQLMNLQLLVKFLDPELANYLGEF